jgi:hypothetical protein
LNPMITYSPASIKHRSHWHKHCKNSWMMTAAQRATINSTISSNRP